MNFCENKHLKYFNWPKLRNSSKCCTLKLYIRVRNPQSVQWPTIRETDCENESSHRRQNIAAKNKTLLIAKYSCCNFLQKAILKLLKSLNSLKWHLLALN